MENNMNITQSKFNADIVSGENCSVQATINGRTMSVPLDPANTHYAEILKQVADGDITIAEAD